MDPYSAAEAAARELVIIVDQDNNEVATATRREMRLQSLPHRATYILVFNRRGELFLQKRTDTKDIYPGYYDVAAGGVVLAGESYEESARRELHEELGISAELTFLFDHHHADATNQVWGRVFRCCHDGPMRLQPEEVADGFFLHPDKIIELAASEPFTPDGLAILARLGKNSGSDAHRPPHRA